jgi:tripartite-type tricarboxylate transporter receptor subunit TctC
MSSIGNRWSLLVLTFLGLLIVSSAARSDAFPTKPIKIIVPFPPGGPTDLIARTIVEAAKPYFSQPLMVVNKGGGGGAIGASEVIQSPPDGHTLGFIPAAVVILVPHLQKVPYKGPEDIEPVLGSIIGPLMFVIRSDAPWPSMKDLLDYAKMNPGKLTTGVTGLGSEPYLLLENIKYISKVNITPVPFEGAAPIVTSLLGNHINSAVLGGPPSIGHVRAGKLKYLAVNTPERIKWAPEVPTLKELGVSAEVFNRGTSFFFFAPKGTPSDILNYINQKLSKACESELVQKVFDDNLVFPVNKTPAELKKQFQEDYNSLREFLREIKISQ